MKTTQLLSLTCVLVPSAITVACGAGDSSSPGDGPGPVVNLVVDNNRNGLLELDSPDEESGEDVWDAASGAIFVVNLDDDDSDGVADNQDAVVNGPNDELDLARLVVQPWPDAAEAVRATILFDATGASAVRVFKRSSDAWAVVDATAPIVLGAEEVRSGVELGIEGLDFVRSTGQPWQGLVEVSLTVLDGDTAVGEDRVQLKAAPWLMNHNLRPFDTVYFSEFSPSFVNTMGPVVQDAGLAVQTFPSDYVNGTGDIWYEDWFQSGWTAMPAKNGGVHGMVVLNPRPWGRDKNPAHLPLTFLRERMLGPDRAVAVFFDEATELGTGSTFDSHGNHEALAPYAEAPSGRLLLGSGIKQSTKDFYAAQAVQPPIYLDTDWLIVGHMDEVYSVVRAATPRGFKMIQNSPALCKELFEKWQADGHGDAVIFEGKTDFEANQWQTTVGQVLSDATMMAWNQEAQAAIDLMHAAVQNEAGVSEDEFVEVPVFYEEVDGGKIAYLPDTANIRVVGEGSVAIFAQTFGPMISGEDAFAKELVARLTDPTRSLGADGNGLSVKFADSWNYHVLLGDVHCASNWSAPPTAAEPTWWASAEAMQ